MTKSKISRINWQLWYIVFFETSNWRKRLAKVPKAASSVELPRPITAVEMRLINGPQIQSPVAGPENITISFICFHMLWFAKSSLFDSTTSTTTSSSSEESETEATLVSFSSLSSSMSSWLALVQAVRNRLRRLFLWEMRILCGGGVVELRRRGVNWLLRKIEGRESRRGIGAPIGVWVGRARVLSCIVEAENWGWDLRLERESERLCTRAVYIVLE